MLITRNKIDVEIMPLVLVMGDGSSLLEDIQQFWADICLGSRGPLPHDVFAVNRSINLYARCKHWGTADLNPADFVGIEILDEDEQELRRIVSVSYDPRNKEWVAHTVL